MLHLCFTSGTRILWTISKFSNWKMDLKILVIPWYTQKIAVFMRKPTDMFRCFLAPNHGAKVFRGHLALGGSALIPPRSVGLSDCKHPWTSKPAKLRSRWPTESAFGILRVGKWSVKLLLFFVPCSLFLLQIKNGWMLEEISGRGSSHLPENVVTHGIFRHLSQWLTMAPAFSARSRIGK